MNIDRRAARRRVKAITAWAAAGAAVLTAGFAFGAARDSSATASAGTATRQPAYAAPRDATPQLPGAGFARPEASSQPPQAMSGGS
jgi:hypothetical protein